MRGRYFAIVPLTGRSTAPAGTATDCIREFNPTVEHPRVRVLTGKNLRRIAADAGAILGVLFGHGESRPTDELLDYDWASIARTHGRHLLERYWGSYVAIVVTPWGVAIVRAPFGDLGCYFTVSGDTLHLASDVPLLLAACESRRTIAIDRVARHIAWPDWRFGETCLDGIGELRGGERLTVTAGELRRDRLWTPWDFIGPEREIDDGAEAACSLRDTIDLTVAARAAICRRPLALLSGGLDSSVVASSLRSAGADLACLNFVAADAASDETAYAGCVAAALGCDLRIERLTSRHIDVQESGAGHLPYPVHRCFTQAQDAIAQAVADELGADAVFDGGGGDNVFFASRSVAIVADCLLREGFGRKFRSAVRSLGDLAEVGLPRLAAMAVHRAWWRTAAPRLGASDGLLNRTWRAELRRWPPHDWFQPPLSALPGRAAHVALLTPAQNMVEAVNAGAPYEAISPLASQPVIEAALRVPSWLWIAPGHDRACVRAAFRERLPSPILDRRSKGTPSTFVAQIFESHRDTIREMLFGGWLAQNGLVDAAALAQALAGEAPVRDLGFAALMTLLDVEAWARAQS
jgi:asparagine synthase (glutamine-hydrolysing)